MKSIQVPQRIGLLAALAMVLACAEHEPATAPVPKLAPAIPSKMASLPPSSGALEVPGGASLSLPSFAAYPEGIKAVFTVTGQINVWSDPRANYFQETVDAGPGGVWIDGDYQQCSVGVLITYGATSFGPPPCNPPGIIRHDPSSIWTFTAVVTGDGAAVRTSNIPVYYPGVCDTIVCHAYTGEHAVLVEPLPGELDLQATYSVEPPARTVRKSLFVHPFTNSEPWAYQQVIFTDSTTPRGLPMRPLSHVWTIQDQTVPGGYWGHTELTATCVGNPNATPPTAPSAYCPTNVKETGKFTSTVRVNGVTNTESICVQCATYDVMTDVQTVRDSMIALSLRSNNGQPFSGRTEHVLMVVKNGWTGQIFTMPIQTADAGPCHASWTPPAVSTLPDSIDVVAFAHTHPLHVDGPSQPCPGQGGRRADGPGGSAEDWRAMAQVNSRADYSAAGWTVPFYVVSNDYLYKMDPSKRPGSDMRPLMRWDKGRCAWVSS